MQSPYVVNPGQGETVWLRSLGAREVLPGERAGGRFALVEHPLPPRGLGSPVHTHEREDEYLYQFRLITSSEPPSGTHRRHHPISVSRPNQIDLI